MDKRLLFAFVLIGAIILLTPKYQELVLGRKAGAPQPPRPSAPADSPIRSDSDSDSLSSSPQNPLTAPILEARDTAFVEREIVVENDLFLSRWSTRGGALKSWVLKDYKDGYHLGPVELIGLHGKGLLVSVGGDDLSAVHFEPSLESFLVTGSSEGTLTFTARVRNSIVEKRLRFSGNRYDFKVDIRLRGELAERKCEVMWRGGIGKNEVNTQDELTHTKVITFMGGVVEYWDTDEAKGSTSRPSGEGGWVGARSKYFLVSVVPEPQRRYGIKISGGQVQDGSKLFDFGLISESDPGVWSGTVYGGPISYSILQAYHPDLQRAMTWGWEWARGFMEPIGIVILQIFLTIHEVVPNYGMVIIIFSLIVKIVLNPLTHKSYEATARMQEIQPQIATLREKYANDQQRLNQEMMRLYKEQGVNPLGGCLPVIFQMPILFALFNVFQNAIELRQAHFVGWISDLSGPDSLSLGEVQIHVLPLLMALSMFLQQKMTIKDPKQMMMVYLMPLMMIFFFWGMSSGLVLYWTMFNLFSWGQQVLIEKVLKAK